MGFARQSLLNGANTIEWHLRKFELKFDCFSTRLYFVSHFALGLEPYPHAISLPLSLSPSLSDCLSGKSTRGMSGGRFVGEGEISEPRVGWLREDARV